MIHNANSPNALVVIPSRLAATRLPNKPLADIHGTPMIVHVWRRATEAGIGPVVVACGDVAIRDAVKAAGGEAVMTRPDHPSGSDRVWEAVQAVDPQGQYDIIVNVQGDMPTLDGGFIRRALDPMADPSVDITTLVCEIADPSERDRPSVVKAVVAWQPRGGIGRALYFSRATVPTGPGPLYHHLGLYAYRRSALERFVSLPPAPLELREKLEQLRALEAGMRIDVVEIATVPLNLDTPEDLERAREMLKG
jgi:3-deoxy-manno-octulosonate cytidylyltransferase (CMP-KDO synthetase)